MLRTGGAAALAQLIVLATMPIASRLFDETAFGVLGLMTSLANILVLTAHLGYLDSMIAADSDEQADDLLGLIILLCVLGSVVNVGLVLAAIQFDILGFGKLPLWVAGFVVAQSAAITIAFSFQQRLIRVERFGPLAASNLALGISRGTGQIGGGLLIPTPMGLVCAELFSRLAMAGFVVANSPRSLWFFSGRLRNIVQLGRRFARFAGFRAVTTLLNGVNIALPTLIIANHFTLTDVGILSFALALIYAPIGLIQKAIGDVFTGTYRRTLPSDATQAWKIFLHTTLILAVIASAVGGGLWAFGEPIFGLIFGEAWRPSGRTAELLAPLIAMMTLVIPLSTSLNIMRRPGTALAFNVVRLLTLGGLLLLVAPMEMDYWQAVCGISFVGTLAYVGFGLAIVLLNFRQTRS
jgi:O-antigen/teichoic acid export membrane protein